MSSSHIFLGLPIDLLILYFELSSGFHSAAFINHLSLGDKAILNASLHFIFVSYLLLISHLFYGFNGAPFDVVYSILQSLQHQSLHHCHSRMTHQCPGRCERQSFVRLRSRRGCSSGRWCLFFAGLDFVFHDLCVSSFRWNDESEHFALRRLNHSFVLFFVGVHVPDA